MTRKRLLAAAAGLVALALRPGLKGQESAEEGGEKDLLSDVDARLASIEKVLLEGSRANATPAAAALDTRLQRLEYRLQRLESKIMMLR